LLYQRKQRRLVLLNYLTLLQHLRYNWIILSFLLFASCEKKKEEEGNKLQGQETASAEAAEKSILFFGNSLTAGYGLEIDQAFPALIQEKIDSLGLDYHVINAGLSGETTASGKNRIRWVLRDKVDIVLLELGANDGLRGIDLDETKRNLQQIINIIREENLSAKIILAGMQIPPNMGPEYTEKFRKIFPQLAEKNDIDLIPFLLEGVGGEPELNQPDGIHPTAEGHEVLAENVWVVLKDHL